MNSFKNCGRFENADYAEVKQNVEYLCIYLNCEFMDHEGEPSCMFVMENLFFLDYIHIDNEEKDSIRILFVEADGAQ